MEIRKFITTKAKTIIVLELIVIAILITYLLNR
jgi:hypothetical protein